MGLHAYALHRLLELWVVQGMAQTDSFGVSVGRRFVAPNLWLQRSCAFIQAACVQFRIKGVPVVGTAFSIIRTAVYSDRPNM